MKPHLVNVVSTCNLNCPLNLRELCYKLPNSSFNPTLFSALIARQRKPRTCCNIFNSGKIVITGAKSRNEALIAARRMARKIQKLGYNVRFSNFRVENLVATISLERKLNLESIVNANPLMCNLEPDLFPGLIIHIKQPKCTALVFRSGKINFTGCKSTRDIYLVWKRVKRIVMSHLK